MDFIKITNREIEFKFRRPTKAEVKKLFDDFATKQGNISTIMETAVLNLCEDKKSLSEFLERKPGALPAIFNKVFEEVGFNENFLIAEK
ncbi:hypothetical protein [Thermospira aquatica]|uniref:Uncharacterized protein n=1 Tax=Thermospira aquatica TaxID=2828656 RepID=A0AAX3BE81_9SPIR|nr:hypothetical protein [Thermospira aquatica]URA10536.1 hypothetical protein KDW03_01670 [Thermospira aquatica]